MAKLVIVFWVCLTALTYAVGFEDVLSASPRAGWHVPESGVLALVGLGMLMMAQMLRRHPEAARLRSSGAAQPLSRPLAIMTPAKASAK
jgi:hypothetical protein